MMTVRFPNGQAVQYNAAKYVEKWGDHMLALRERRGSKAIALVPVTCIVELVEPCRVYNLLALSENVRLERELRLVRAALEAKKRKRGKR